MEFNKKLQDLRKAKGITQEELAASLYVSRTAISKWESGRGYPNIESLKAIAKFFAVTVDELISSDEILTIAEEDNRQKEKHFRDPLYGLLDCCIAMLFFLPLFGQQVNDVIEAVPLISLSEIALWLRISYFALVSAVVTFGIITLAMQNCNQRFWVKNKTKISFALNAAGVLLFIVSTQPYAATFLFVFFLIKILMLIKWH